MTDSGESGPGNAIVSAMNATGAPATIKSKVQKAILRLIVGAVDPDHIERLRANASTVEGRSRIDAMVAEEIGRQAIADPLFMERAKARFLGDLAQKQENVEAVASKAQEKIDSADDADAAPIEPDAEPSQDWMNAFARAAEDASSEELRERLASILAGEARKPGTFSRSTIRLLAEMERDILQEFQSILPYKFGDAIQRKDAWNSGEMFSRSLMLESHGLISGSGGFTNRQVTIGENGLGFLIGNYKGLVFEGDPGHILQVGIWILTRAGIEIASLLVEDGEERPLTEIAMECDKSNLKKITLGRIVEIGGQSRIAYETVLWEQPTPA